MKKLYNGTPYVAYADVTNNDEATVMEYTGESRGSMWAAPISPTA
jgi:hypothetical protein